MRTGVAPKNIEDQKIEWDLSRISCF